MANFFLKDVRKVIYFSKASLAKLHRADAHG